MLANEISRVEFEQLARAMMEFLCNNCHPHVTVIITPTGAELLEGVMSTGPILDYIKD